MRTAFFTDHRFARDAAGVHYSYGGLPYGALARYVKHFDEVVVVGRVSDEAKPGMTVASGPGLRMACVEQSSPLALFGGPVRRHVRDVLGSVDCAIVRLPSFIGEVVVGEAIHASRPWMAEVVGCPWDALWNHGTVGGRLLAAPMFVMTRRQVASAPFALYVTREYLQRRYPSRGETVGCSDAVIESPSAAVLERRLLRIAAPPSARPVRLGLVGSLDVDYKGHDVALRALAELRSSTPAVRLSCLGGGDAARWRRRAAELGVEDLVEFAGTLPHGAPVLEWMDGLDVFVIPSLLEGLPRALVEAMSRALPVVGSAVGGIPELVDARHVHPRGDGRALAALLRRLVASPAELEECARGNWSAAASYTAAALDARRDAFMSRFKAHALARRA
jgi:hypothetical protein